MYGPRESTAVSMDVGLSVCVSICGIQELKEVNITNMYNFHDCSVMLILQILGHK